MHDFISDMRATEIPRMLRVELSVRPATNPPRLHGSGLILVNPPFVLEDELRALMPALATLLGDDGAGRHKIEWIKGEA